MTGGKSKSSRASKASSPEPGADGQDTGADTGTDEVRMQQNVS